MIVNYLYNLHSINKYIYIQKKNIKNIKIKLIALKHFILFFNFRNFKGMNLDFLKQDKRHTRLFNNI